MMNERQMLEAMLASTPEQCRTAGDLFLALADRPRDIHFKADLQRRLDALPPEAADGRALRLAVARSRAVGRSDDLWRAGWHPLQIIAHLKATGFTGNPGEQEPPSIADLAEIDTMLADAGFGNLGLDRGTA